MRQRQQLVISRRAGDAVLTTEAVDDGADFSGRIAGLKDSVATKNLGAVEARLLTLACDGCGATAELDYDDPQMPEGWAEHTDGDYCPRCQFLRLPAAHMSAFRSTTGTPRPGPVPPCGRAAGGGGWSVSVVTGQA